MVPQKLRHLKQVLKAWNKNHFGNITESRQKLEQEMSILQQTIITVGRTEELAHKEQSLWTALEARRSQEEILWRQKSRKKWLKEGEKTPNSSTELQSSEECTIILPSSITVGGEN